MATAALGTLALLAVAGCRVDAAAGPGLSPAPPPPATTEDARPPAALPAPATADAVPGAHHGHAQAPATPAHAVRDEARRPGRPHAARPDQRAGA